MEPHSFVVSRSVFCSSYSNKTALINPSINQLIFAIIIIVPALLSYTEWLCDRIRNKTGMKFSLFTSTDLRIFICLSPMRMDVLFRCILSNFFYPIHSTFSFTSDSLSRITCDRCDRLGRLGTFGPQNNFSLRPTSPDAWVCIRDTVIWFCMRR